MSRTLVTGLDLETTGLDMLEGGKLGDRIIEVCLQVYDLEERKLLLDFTRRVNPDGRKMNAKAQKVHNIAATDLIGKPLFKEIAPQIQAILQRSSAVVAHNGDSFDLPFLALEMDAAGYELPSKLACFDTMCNGMWASYDHKPPRLEEVCWAMGVEYDPAKAHAAQYDVQVMMEAFFKALDRGLFTLDVPTEERSAA